MSAPIVWQLNDGTRPDLRCSRCGRRTPMLEHGLGFDCCAPRSPEILAEIERLKGEAG